MLKIALVGCGKIADNHVEQILRVSGCEIVGVCDSEPLMAQQLRERFPIRESFSDLSQMLERARPDVVHITTPPGSHLSVAADCLRAGCHVYVEKPFTLTERDAVALIAMAEERGLKVTAGHDDQFTHAARRMRDLMQSGYAGCPVHMESYYCYELGTSGYTSALMGDPRHWVRSLPGKLLHNVISHGIARIGEYLDSDSPSVIAHGFTSQLLASRGERELIDELRVILSTARGTTAYFTFSSQMRPVLHQFRLYGSRNGIVLDHDQQTVIKVRGRMYPSYAEKFVPPLQLAGQYLENWSTNLRTFLRHDFHMKSGMKFLIESFYSSIQQGTPVPIPYREILLTARIMDSIFGQLAEHSASPQGDPRQSLCL